MITHLDAFEVSGASPPRLAERYLTPAQVADMLQVSEKTVYRWAATEATMPVLRVGGTVRFPRERLLRWLQDREQGRRRRAVTHGVAQARDGVAQVRVTTGVTD